LPVVLGATAVDGLKPILDRDYTHRIEREDTHTSCSTEDNGCVNDASTLATVGLLGQEGRVMRLNMIPLLYYSTGVGLLCLLCLLFGYVLFSGVF